MTQPKVKTVLELYENHPERWIKHTNAKTIWHETVRATHPQAVCWCLYAAILFVHNGTDVAGKLRTAVFVLEQLFDERDLSIVGFNDKPDRTFNDVLMAARELHKYGI